ncbi:OmpA family protein [Actinomadura sp. 9N407]|uniref:OmpA family protein n=1 Tax=Actinomadura sp. 9N407 TaxID=3375154 RepID=UPI0037ADF8FA
MKTLITIASVITLATACTGGSPETPGRSTAARPATSAPAPATTGPEPTSCPNGGQLIKAVEVPAVHADPVHVPEATIGGQKVPAVTIPGVDITARHIPAQCVSIKPAPGGCLSAIDIPGNQIPAVTIPAVTVPGVNAGGAKAEPVTADAATADGAVVDGVHVDEVCQLKPSKEGEYVSSAYRRSAYRASVYRRSAHRRSVYRPRTCNAANECVPAVTVPSVTAPSVSIPSVSVRSASIKSYTAGRSQVFKGDDSIAYNIEADVLFDFGRADIKPAAAAGLKKIADSIKKETPAGATIQVDGHTDAKGDPATNQRLSEQRAKAILVWLSRNGGISPSRLKATGYGETKPVAANTTATGADDPGGRAKNRRVVISAKQN